MGPICFSLSLYIYLSLCLAVSLLQVVIASRLWVTCHSQRTCTQSFSRVQSRRTFVKFEPKTCAIICLLLLSYIVRYIYIYLTNLLFGSLLIRSPFVHRLTLTKLLMNPLCVARFQHGLYNGIIIGTRVLYANKSSSSCCKFN